MGSWSQGRSTSLFTRLESLAWSQEGFWQPSFCRKCTLLSLSFVGGNMVLLLFIDFLGEKGIFREAWKDEEQTCLHFSLSPWKQCRETTPTKESYPEKKSVTVFSKRPWPPAPPVFLKPFKELFLNPILCKLKFLKVFWSWLFSPIIVEKWLNHSRKISS